jgi:predicted enzyme related to lactoylglutathione lyase
MERVTGIGGIFFRARDPQKLAAWYEEHLGICLGWASGALFKWEERGGTLWSHRPITPSQMIHFRVGNLDRMLEQLRAAGVQIDPETEESVLGKVGWCMDPEGNRVELWEPPATHDGPKRHAAPARPRRTGGSSPDHRLAAHVDRR